MRLLISIGSKLSVGNPCLDNFSSHFSVSIMACAPFCWVFKWDICNSPCAALTMLQARLVKGHLFGLERWIGCPVLAA